MHTATNSNRSRVVERCVDVKTLARRRADKDVPELRVLREMSALLKAFVVRLEWLIDHNKLEDRDHLDLEQASLEICDRMENSTAASALNTCSG
ncbi:MAG: hypothetical protein M1482_10920 [Chloroflexi bacterium]|nr:hypothetical protein [Chloroflexota bacterium]